MVDEVESFNYLESFELKKGCFVKDVKYRVKFGWIEWREVSDISCDKRIPIRLISKFYKSAVKPSMLYGSESWMVDKKIEQMTNVEGTL